ncbi:peptidyl-prolyl cis-trans isomerase B (cyclophilin B) [Hathewaya proteolytica DSM 3090]|uniref:Peptidyl-prolyl cis-trans isomerase n=1 Tax=Hathewaya proteolytica DSM 3090 TaxID=1121331 RepID=A0A1M6P6S7_9CLOT|nr:peptidylprolyl isomerase [Hathewaya proteolytica]SHK03600.1 peptidyl-prolyl cis-trans isomerase B (cyclophilin B) [Hathewaya proteolytica DSM 3090]
MKKLISILLTCFLAFSIIGCSKGNDSTSSDSNKENKTEVEQKDDKKDDKEDKKDTSKVENMPNEELIQFKEPKDGESIAVLETSMGKIKLMLFPSEAPKAVENFTKLIEKKYYDGIIFHRVIKDFMIQGGDPTGTGTGGESIYGKGFDYEVTPKLHHFRGTLAMAHSSLPASNGSQFYIVQGTEVLQDTVDQMKKIGGESFTDPVIEQYKKVGGVPQLDYQYTIFGQVIEGMDVVDKIAAVETSKDKTSLDKPLKEVKIIKAYLEKYKK